MTIHNVLKQNKITRKRRKLRYFPPDQKISKAQELKQFYKNLDKIDKKKLISLDETAIYINMMPIYGRTKSGKRLIIETSNYPFKKYNLLCAIKENRIVGWVLYENLKGGVKKEQLVEFIKKYINNRYKNYHILMDNASFHRSHVVKNELLKKNNKILFCVRYNPQTNPIEEFFSQTKHYVRKLSPLNYAEIYKTLEEIFKTKVKKSHLQNYFKHVFIKIEK